MSTTNRTSWSATSTLSPSSHSRARTVSASNGLRTASGVVEAMAQEAIAALAREGHVGPPALLRSLSMRYVGQNYERDVPLPDGELDELGLEATLDRFHEHHRAFYGYSFPGEPVEVIHFNLTALAAAEAPVVA